MDLEVFGVPLVIPGVDRRTRRALIPLTSALRRSRSIDMPVVSLAAPTPINPHSAIRAINQWAATPTVSGLVVLHAGLVDWGGATTLVAGSSYAGKSTFVAALCQHEGARYGGDEHTAIRIASRAAVAYPKPPAIKVRSWPLVERTVRPDVGWRDDVTWLLPPEVLVGGLVDEERSPDLIVFPEFCGCDDQEVRPLSPAESTFRLCELATNLADAGVDGFQAIGAICRRARSVVVRHGDAISAVDALAQQVGP